MFQTRDLYQGSRMEKRIFCKYKIHKFYVFIFFILLLKILLAALFSSDYQNRMFIPFVQAFLKNIGSGNYNVYQYYWENNLISSFPYPPFMLFAECVSGVLLKLFRPEHVFISNLLAKLPLFFFDWMTLHFLVKLFPLERRYAGILYFASPVILYSTFMHGQLDIIPTAFLMASLYYLRDGRKRKNEFLSALFYGAALLSKFHVIAVLPIILLYLLRKSNIRAVLHYFAIISAEVVMVVIPFWSEGFIRTVLLNAEQNAIGIVQLYFSSVSFYIPVFAVIWIYLLAFYIGRVNHDLLMSFCGIIFSVFLALCPPMPGWYVWIIPFVVLFFIMISDNRYRNILLYGVLNVLYVCYFVFFHRTEYVDLYFGNQNLNFLKLSDYQLKNIMFTLLGAVLLYIIWQMYHYGVASNSLYKRKSTPFTIGISGDSGSGKSTFLEILKKTLGEQNLRFIEGDGDHRWERGEKMWEAYTHLNPKANFLYRQANDIQRLKNGTATKRVEYNHKTGKFTALHKIKPKQYILICGLHSLYLPQMRRNLDLKIYMDAEEKLRRFWKIQRDTSKRGYSREQILEQIDKRLPDAKKYIYPQKKYADMIIQYFDRNLKEDTSQDYEVVMSMRLFLSAAIDIEPLLLELGKWGVNASYDFGTDLEHQVVEFDGENLSTKEIPFRDIAEYVIPQLDEVTKQELTGLSGLEGILALFVLTLISKIMQEEL